MTHPVPDDAPGGRWVDIVAALSHARVQCIGDIMLDRFVSGSVERISPEAPVPVLRARVSSTVPGGVGNVARNVTALGAKAILCAATGADDDALSLQAILEPDSSIDARLFADASQPTTVKSRYVSGGNHMLRVDIDPTGPLTRQTLDAIERAFADCANRVGALVLSDYGKGVLEEGLLRRVIAMARSRGLPIIVDPKGSDYERYRGVSVVTPNRNELAEAVGRPVAGDKEIVKAANELITRFDIAAVLVTRSEEGMTLVRRDGDAQHFRTEAVEVYDVAGAGDTVVATVATVLACGLPLETAIPLANIAAGIVVRKIGTAIVSRQELRAKVATRLDGQVGKLLTRQQCFEQTAVWRAEGRRIGFTNGCFDILHAGHIELLRNARAAVDRLVLGLNSDLSVRGLKGPTRPINSQDARARVLSAIEYVDAIVIFDEPTPEQLIQGLRPDVLMKGSDYTIDQVVGARLVKSYGGDVQLIDLVQGYSSTAIVERMWVS